MENCPSITLRKGKTEIKIENAAAIIKKINEICPPRSDYDSWYYAPSWNIKQKKTEAQIEKQRQWIESAKDWFKNEMFNGTGSFEVIVNEPELPKTILPEELENKSIRLTDIPDIGGFDHTYATYYTPRVNGTPAKDLPIYDTPEPQVIQSVNKNAYEIRLDVLKEAIHWISTVGLSSIPVPSGEKIVSEDQKNGDAVIALAKKFYSFVENRR